jgi:hypothetical protein
MARWRGRKAREFPTAQPENGILGRHPSPTPEWCGGALGDQLAFLIGLVLLGRNGHHLARFTERTHHQHDGVSGNQH